MLASTLSSTAKYRLQPSQLLALQSGIAIHHFERIMLYKVALKKTDEGYSVSCPGLPGCWSQGNTEAEALENIADAIAEYLSVAAELAQAENTEMREVEVAA